MNLIKGLESGFCHTWVTGDSKWRTSAFNKEYKAHVDAGKFIRDIQYAPRDARYRIDHYYSSETTEADSVPFPYIDFFYEILYILNIDETFSWKKNLRDNKSEYTFGDFTIGFGDYTIESYFYDGKDLHSSGYYFKYKGEHNTLMFNYRPELVDYSNSLYAKYKDKPQYYDKVSDLLHNMCYFIRYYEI